MKFLIDQNIRESVAVELQRTGHDAVHVRAYGLHRAEDRQALERARAENRVLVSGDADFSALLAREEAVSPSLILFRPSRGRGSVGLHSLILENVLEIENAVHDGSIIVIERSRIRVRRLPVDPTTH